MVVGDQKKDGRMQSDWFKPCHCWILIAMVMDTKDFREMDSDNGSS